MLARWRSGCEGDSRGDGGKEKLVFFGHACRRDEMVKDISPSHHQVGLVTCQSRILSTIDDLGTWPPLNRSSLSEPNIFGQNNKTPRFSFYSDLTFPIAAHHAMKEFLILLFFASAIVAGEGRIWNLKGPEISKSG